MITHLMYKEFRLNIKPWTYFWFISVLFLIVPAMPYSIGMAYICFFFMFVSQFDKINQDFTFSAFLPVLKSTKVTARMITIVLVEVVFMILAVPVAVAHDSLYATNNPAGMNPNLAFFGLMFMMYAVFNIIYLTGTYKQPYRMAWPIVGGALVSMIVGAILTIPVPFIPALAIINDRGLGHLGAQVTVLVAGFIVYAGLTLIAHHNAVANFSKVDL